MSEIVSVFKDIAQLNPLFRDQITNFSINPTHPMSSANRTSLLTLLRPLRLASLVVEDQLCKALLVLKKELVNAQLQGKLSRNVDSKIAKRQREYYLMEQLRGIKKDLGMGSDGKGKLIKMPEPVRKVFEEISKLACLEPAASEANVARNYLKWLTQIPWGQHTPENYSITHARTVLDEGHYGLKDVKDRIPEFLTVRKLRGTVEGKIICLVGPPGVGKTLIRNALPGKIIQALKRGSTENPLVLIDEVDKIGRGRNGDPASALLEMLNPEQNNSFLDHYMNVPVDLFHVLVLEASGYVSEEKAVIDNKYLGPQAKEASGLKEANVDALIKYYCRESGVRNLKKHIDKRLSSSSKEAFPEPAPVSTSAADTKTVESQEPSGNDIRKNSIYVARYSAT
ncbi:P-loop containing nucleoside triphosphate hydrolase protein [Infundibulicybe gibba]|nr:P-loop containing nucleoside triphosphate hydrolase protein [Infundibulicybe gibba]